MLIVQSINMLIENLLFEESIEKFNKSFVNLLYAFEYLNIIYEFKSFDEASELITEYHYNLENKEQTIKYLLKISNLLLDDMNKNDVNYQLP